MFTNGKKGFGESTWLCKQQYVYLSNQDEGKDYAAEYPDYTFGDRSSSVGQYYDHIISDFEALGGEYLLETEAYELMLDDAGSKVTGVKARNHADGTEYVINARAVIMCTGGFGGNGDMMEKHLQNPEYPLAARWHLWGMYQNKGAMIASAIDKGAGTYNIDMSPCIHFKTTSDYLTEYPCYYRDGLEERMLEQNTWSLNDIPMMMGINASALQVGDDGVRHYNESGTFAFWAGGPSWFTIYGGDYVDGLAQNGYPGEEGAFQSSTKVFGQGGYPQATPIPQIYEVLETAEKKGYAFKADTLEELAEKIGVPADAFKAQVERYEGYCRAAWTRSSARAPKPLSRRSTVRPTTPSRPMPPRTPPSPRSTSTPTSTCSRQTAPRRSAACTPAATTAEACCTRTSNRMRNTAAWRSAGHSRRAALRARMRPHT